MDQTLFGTITFQHNSLPCIEFNKKPKFECIALKLDDSEMTTTIITPSICQHIVKCDKKPNMSLKNAIIELLQQDYDDTELSEKLSMLVNHNTASLFKDMPCSINDTVYVATNNGTSDAIVKGTSMGLVIGKVVNFVIDMNNTRYIEIKTKYGNKLLSEKDFKHVVTTPFNPLF